VAREKVSVRLAPEAARWLRREAAERHITVSALVEECVRRAMGADRLEMFVRACLQGVAELVAGEGARAEDVRGAKIRLLGAAKGEMYGGKGRGGQGPG